MKRIEYNSQKINETYFSKEENYSAIFPVNIDAKTLNKIPPNQIQGHIKIIYHYQMDSIQRCKLSLTYTS